MTQSYRRWSLRGLLLGLSGLSVSCVTLLYLAISLHDDMVEIPAVAVEHTRQLVELAEPLLVGALVVGDLATAQQTIRRMVEEGSLSRVTLYEAGTSTVLLEEQSPRNAIYLRSVPRWFVSAFAGSVGPMRKPLAAGGVTYAELSALPSVDRVLGAVWANALETVALGIGTLLAQIALLSWILGRGMRPLHDLEQAALRMAGGDLSARMPATSFAEIGTVADAFNKMAANVGHLMQALRESEEHHRSVVDALAEGVIVLTDEGTIQSYNPAARRILGRDKEHMVGALLRDKCCGEVGEDGLPLADDQHPARVTLRTGEPVSDFIVGIDSREGETSLTHWISINSQPLFSGDDTQPHAVVLSLSDVTERKETADRLRLAAAVFENTRERVVIADSAPRIVAINGAFTETTGYSEAESIGQNPGFIRSGRHNATFYQAMWDELHQRGHWQGEMWNRTKLGEIYPEWVSISAVKDERGTITHYVGVSTNISVIKQAEDRLRHLAHYDALTDLPNRLLLLSRLDHALERARRHGHRIAVLYLDLDRFKQINDNFGHEAGDELLRVVSSRFLGRLRDEDTLARFGGDEFVALLEGIQKTDNIINIVQDMIRLGGEPVCFEGDKTATVGVSIGVSFFPEHGQTADELLSNADGALYKAKAAGRNTYRLA